MFPRPPAVGSVDYSALYLAYLQRVDACISLRGVLGDARSSVGCLGSCDFDSGVVACDGPGACGAISPGSAAVGGESSGDGGGDGVVAGSSLGVGCCASVSGEGIGCTQNCSRCGGSDAVDARIDSLPGIAVRGPNYMRNERSRRNARRRAARVAKETAMAGDWRAGTTGKFPGFFDECAVDTQRELRESRARMYIAKNNRQAAEEQDKINRMGSAEHVVTELVRVTKLAAQLKKHTKDEKIGGWAETVAESLSKSVAASAPSSVPSLESVGYGKTALNSDVGSGVDPVRRAAYEADLKRLKDDFDLVDFVSDEDYDRAMRDLKQRYADVCYSKEELQRRDLVKSLSSAMCAGGMGFAKVEEVFEKVGIDLYEY